jgi:hypothetical protein
MPAFALFASALATAAFAQGAPAPAGAPVPPKADANFVGVVIGLSSYETLPDAVELDFARSDAAFVHKQLKGSANYTETWLLADGEATREKIRDLLRTQVAQLVGPDDVLLIYFVGHGVGADLDEPALLTYESTLTAASETGFELGQLARDISTLTPAGTTLIVTDAIHSNQLDGIYFFGPAANQWPSTPRGTMVLSSSQADSPARDGAFGTPFGEAIAGAADLNLDSMVTAGELETYMAARVSPSGQIPIAAGDYDKNMVVARGVKNLQTNPATGMPDITPQFPDVEVWSAKFVFREGASQTVQCSGLPVRSCSPSCYVRDFKAGVCQLKAVVDGVELTGRVAATYAGKYDCGLKAGLLTCKPPIQDAAKTE